MHFDSMSDFFAMGGYAAYVWSSFCISFIAMLWILFSSMATQRRLLGDIKNKMAREERIKEAKKLENTL
ncbi:heme exporter protein CcmD [Photobacterium leiognathi]|uniref:heme exporter protein CcmD n=1 Tax=Photobacterium leiognathi TaxID=553611 RepID=UPI002981BCD8|nr:heme exporter protein CcmD [Photobacterium leiognathi]